MKEIRRIMSGAIGRNDDDARGRVLTFCKTHKHTHLTAVALKLSASHVYINMRGEKIPVWIIFFDVLNARSFNINVTLMAIMQSIKIISHLKKIKTNP